MKTKEDSKQIYEMYYGKEVSEEKVGDLPKGFIARFNNALTNVEDSIKFAQREKLDSKIIRDLKKIHQQMMLFARDK